MREFEVSGQISLDISDPAVDSTETTSSSTPTPVSSCTTIIDLDAVSLNLLWNLRSHLQEASTLATANYPETLSTIAVVNSPSFFPTVWGWIKVRPPTTPSPASWRTSVAGFSSGQ